MNHNLVLDLYAWPNNQNEIIFCDTNLLFHEDFRVNTYSPALGASGVLLYVSSQKLGEEDVSVGGLDGNPIFAKFRQKRFDKHNSYKKRLLADSWEPPHAMQFCCAHRAKCFLVFLCRFPFSSVFCLRYQGLHNSFLCFLSLERGSQLCAFPNCWLISYRVVRATLLLLFSSRT